MRRAALGLAAGLLVAIAVGVLATEALGAFPGKPGRIAYHDDGAIYAIRPNGTGLRTIVRANAPAGPSYSPGGRRLVFTTYPDRLRIERNTLEVVRADGTRRRRLAKRGDHWPHWSPNGRRLVFIREHPCAAYENLEEPPCPARLQRSTNWGLTVYTGGRTRSLLNRGAYSAWSPVGGWIVFSALGHLELIRPDGSGLRSVFTDPRVVGEPEWSPNGRRIVFAYYPDGPPDPNATTAPRVGIASIRADGTGFRELTSDGFSPAYSPDGRHIVFTRQLRRFCDFGTYGALGLLWLMRPDGTGQRLVQTRTGRPFCGADPDWQSLPDAPSSSRSSRSR